MLTKCGEIPHKNPQKANKRKHGQKNLVKRPSSNGPRQPECCTAPAQKIWWCYCRLDCLPRMPACKCNSKPSFLTTVVTALCVALWQPTNQTTNPLFQFPFVREQIFKMISMSTTITQRKHLFSSCEIELR